MPSGGVDPAGQPRRDLLQEPAVAVRVGERGKGAVGGVAGRRPTHATARAVGRELRARRAGVENLADRGAMGDEIRARSLDVGDNQIKPPGGAGRGRRDVGAELDRARRAGRRELDDAETIIEAEVGVEPPAEPAVEGLGPIDVRDRDDDRLELQVEGARARGLAGGFAA